MSLSARSLSRPRLVGTAIAIGAIAVTSACSSGTSNSANQQQAPNASSSTSSADQAVLNTVYKGTLQPPDTTSRPGVKGKKIVIISSGQSNISNQIPVDAAAEAARLLGWKVTIYDTQENPANDPTLMSQALASGADGIIVDAIDCSFIKSQLQQAQAKHVLVVPIYSYDCNDPLVGGKAGGPALFAGYTNYVAAANKNLGAFAEQYGFAQGQAVIAATGGKAKVLFFNDPDATVLKYTGRGFLNAIHQCAGCKILADVEFKGLDLGPTLQQRAASVLLQHPDANAVKSPFTAATLLSIAPAVQQSGRANQLYVMGGEGFQPELDLMRTHQGVNAVMISPSDWTGWSAVDTLNSLFQGKKPAFSGLGWQLIDATHNLPASGPWVSPIDFKAAYKKAWGIS